MKMKMKIKEWTKNWGGTKQMSKEKLWKPIKCKKESIKVKYRVTEDFSNEILINDRLD